MIPFALLLLGVASRHPAPTDRAHIETVEAIVARLQPPSGTRVRVVPSLQGLFAYLEPHGASALVALRALATALHASVVETPGEWTLETTDADAKAAERTRVADRLAWIRLREDTVERYRADALKGRTLRAAVAAEVERETRISEQMSRHDKVTPDPYFATELLPAEELLLALVHRIGEAKIAAVPVADGFRVWEDDPVPGANALPEHREAVEAYEKAVAEIRGAFISPRLQAGIDRLGMEAPFADWRDDSSPLARLRVRVRSESTRLLVTLEGYDAAGGQRTAATLIAMPKTVWRPPPVIAKEASERPETEWVPLSDATLAAATPSSTVVSARRAGPSWFTDPEVNEPLDRMAGEALAALEPGETRRCVAVQAVDELWRDVQPSVFGSRLSLAALRTMMREDVRYERVESGESVVWRVRDAPGRAGNVDRRVLGAFARATLRSGVLDLRGLALFHRAIGPAPTALSSFWEGTLRYSPAIRTFSGDAWHPFYRMLGAISASDWDALRSGTPETVERLGVGNDFAAVLDEDLTPVESPRPFPDVLKHLPESFGVDPPGAAVLALGSVRTPLLGTASRRGEPSVMWGGVPIPSQLELFDNPPTNEVPTLTRERYERFLGRILVQTGYQDRTTVQIRFPNGLIQRAEFKDPIVATSALSDYSALPQEVQDAIWERAKQLYSP